MKWTTKIPYRLSRSLKSISAGNKFALLSLIVAVVGIIAGIASSDIRNATESAYRSWFPPPKPVVVGSRDYPEQYVIGEFIAQMLEENDVKVQRSFKIEGDHLRRAIEKGEIDVYMEYTGAAYNLVFKQNKILDKMRSRNEAAVYDFVRKSYKKKESTSANPSIFKMSGRS